MTFDPSVAHAAIEQADSQTIKLGPGATLQDIDLFKQAMSAAQQSPVPNAPHAVEGLGEHLKSMFKPLDLINAEAKEIAMKAEKISASGNSATPGELLNMTVKSQEFMFHCTLTSNIANRTSDGLQQLFRQQS